MIGEMSPYGLRFVAFVLLRVESGLPVGGASRAHAVEPRIRATSRPLRTLIAPAVALRTFCPLWRPGPAY